MSRGYPGGLELSLGGISQSCIFHLFHGYALTHGVFNVSHCYVLC